MDLQLLTINHQENYFFRDGLDGNPQHRIPGLSSHSTSYGFETSLSYRLLPPFRISGGIGYQRIIVRGLSGLIQGRLPIDRRSDTYELVLSQKTTYHIAQVPVKLIIDLFPGKKIHPTLNVGIAGQYYFRANYFALNFEKYSGPVEKNDFVGWSSFLGLDVFVNLTARVAAKFGYEYILDNPEYLDDLHFNQGPADAGVGTYGIPLTFNYQVFIVGLSRSL